MSNSNKQTVKRGIINNKIFENLIAKKPRMIPKVMETVQASIPIHTVHDKENIIETYPGCYTKSYALTNINYQTSTEQEQELILTKWRAFLNSLG